MRSVKKREKWGEVNPLTDHFKDTNKKIIIIKHREGEREDLCTQEKERAKKKPESPRDTTEEEREERKEGRGEGTQRVDLSRESKRVHKEGSKTARGKGRRGSADTDAQGQSVAVFLSYLLLMLHA